MDNPVTHQALTWLLSFFVFLWTFSRVRRWGFPEGAWLPFFLVLLCSPAWLWSGVGSLRVDLRSVMGMTILLLFLMQPIANAQRIQLILADYVMLGIITAQAITEFSQEKLTPMTPIEQIREWGLPYIAGRVLLNRREDVFRWLGVLVPVLIGLCVYCLIESFSKVNLVNQILGKRWELLETTEGFRWGLKRAQGPTNHPIYIGLVLTMMLPFLLEAYHLAKARLAPGWWQLLPLLGTMAMIGTVSRAAQLATGITFVADFIFRRPRWRTLLITLCLLGGGISFLFRNEILEALSKYAGEKPGEGEVVKISGKEYPYTGTLHRDLLQLVYAEATEKVPLLGYGYNLQNLPIDSEVDPRFRSIDDHYLLYYLRFGPVGMFLFICFVICITVYLLWEAWKFDRITAGLCGALFGAFLGTTFMVKGVAMEADVSCVWLFVAGVATRFRVLRLQETERPFRS